MAQNFRNYITRNTGATPVDILPAAQVDSYDAVVGIRLANVHASTDIEVDVYIVRTNNYYLIKAVPIVVGGSLELIDGGSKIVLHSGDKIMAVSDTASSLDVVVSYIDAIST
jgi:hypothetical protein|tara:strand:- start:217 stop:552 length:336 start_codon:yes stop_codon:yes gene_type:complete